MLNAILVDDEWSSLQNLQQKLTEFCPDIAIVGTTQKPEEAINLIQHHQPDVVFLDIEMPRMNGFRMLEELGAFEGDIIFTTAYQNYAIDAIRISAFDYLTKPIGITDLQRSVERLVQTKMKNRLTGDRLDVLRHSLLDMKTQEGRIAIATQEGIEFIEIRNILRMESSSNYCKIFFVEGKPMLVTRLLKDFEDMLLPHRFFRVHHSHLINLNYIKKYIKGDGGQVMLINDEKIDISRRKKEEFLKMIHAG